MSEIDRWSDSALKDEIDRLRAAIKIWISSRNYWIEWTFRSYLEHFDGEPKDPPIATLLICESGMDDFVNGYDDNFGEEQFIDLLAGLGYWWENLDAVTAAIYPEDEALKTAFADYFHWQWICSLVQEDTSDVYEELYHHFARRPDDLHRLSWREFEILLCRIFQNQGFVAELGPGRGDNGIDLRLFQRDPIGDILTVVQAKRYARNNKIDHTQVAALYGVKAVEGADRALFVTTSSYAPVAQRFAARTKDQLVLAQHDDIIRWCEQATAGIIADKSTLVSSNTVSRIITEVSDRRDPRIVQTSFGYNMTRNEFALIVKETQHAALLMQLPARTVSDDGCGQRGLEVPLFDGTTIQRWDGRTVWRAKRKKYDDRFNYWDGEHLYGAWNGEPAPFDYMD